MINPIISHKHKYVYFIIPKNACSTVRHLLLKQILNDNDLPYRVNDLKKLPKIKYRNVNKYKNYFWFTIIRNPYDRIISCYKDKVIGADPIYKPLYNPVLSFENFVDNTHRTDDNIIDWHAKSQSYYIGDYLDNMDFIGTVEQFEVSILWIKKQIGNDFTFEHLRKTRNTNRRQYIKNKYIANQIFSRYKDDFITGNYDRNC